MMRALQDGIHPPPEFFFNGRPPGRFADIHLDYLTNAVEDFNVLFRPAALNRSGF